MIPRTDWRMRQFVDEQLAMYKPENRFAIAKKFYERGVPMHVALRVLK